ncbi:MAG: alpha-galactosidase [Deltaproteobacteria bacterium]|nr:alpha-galactosidase [Deltaproteobacteria bacterium]
MPMTVAWSEQRGQLVLEGLFEAPIPFSVEVRYHDAQGEDCVFRPTTARAIESGWRFEGEHLVVDLAARSVEGGVRVDWSVEARTEVHLKQVLPARFGPEWPHLEDPKRVRAFQNGFQSWTPSYGVRGDHRQVRPLIHLFSMMSHYVDSPWWVRQDGFTSNGFLVLQGEEEETATLLGFLSYRVGHGELFVRNQGRRELIASADYGGRRCAAGERVAGEALWALWIGRGTADTLVDRWAELAATEMGMEGGRRPDGAVDPSRSPLGWCSWYEYYTGVAEADVLANLEVLRENPQLGVAVMQLDDGYQTAVGDWLSINHKFPRGLGPLADDIRASGFSAGIWTAPFFLSARSRVFQEHPDWCVRDGRGRPLFSSYNPMWNTRLYSVDLTHPEVEAWLAETYGALVEAGYDYHKIDFLYAGIRYGTRHDPGRSPVEAYRNGLRVIREALGPERFLLGCGAPLGPSLGYLDAMRISQDVKESWDDWYARWFGRGGGYPTARGALRNVMTRSFLHRRWWLNDPDCLLVRDRNTKLDLHETRLLLTVLGMSGGMLFLSGCCFSPTTWRPWRRTVSTSPKRSCPPVPWTDDRPTCWRPKRPAPIGSWGRDVGWRPWSTGRRGRCCARCRAATPRRRRGTSGINAWSSPPRSMCPGTGCARCSSPRCAPIRTWWAPRCTWSPWRTGASQRTSMPRRADWWWVAPVWPVARARSGSGSPRAGSWSTRGSTKRCRWSTGGRTAWSSPSRFAQGTMMGGRWRSPLRAATGEGTRDASETHNHRGGSRRGEGHPDAVGGSQGVGARRRQGAGPVRARRARGGGRRRPGGGDRPPGRGSAVRARPGLQVCAADRSARHGPCRRLRPRGGGGCRAGGGDGG